MGDLNFFIPSGGGGGAGTGNYNELTNTPVVNVGGTPVLLDTLATGVYSISGTWAVTEGAEIFDTTSGDDLFYVTTDAAGCRMTLVSAGSIRTATLPAGGNAADIQYDKAAMGGEAAQEIMDRLWGAF